MTGTAFDLAIIGAGPAGMAAAVTARRHGLSVIVFDEQGGPGGQAYRAVMRPRGVREDHVLGADYQAGRPLAEAFLASGAAFHPHALVWRTDGEGLSWTSRDGGGEVTARVTLAATGAMERPFPVEGWTLPGVMTAGAAQILLKTSGTVHEGAVFAGCGPLLYLVAAQYVRAGVKVRALLDTTPPAHRIQALAHIPRTLAAWAYLGKGLRLLAEIRRAGMRVVRRVEEIAFLGRDAVSAVRWRGPRGEDTLACDQVFVHHGVIPNVNLTMAAGCRHRWDERQCCWRPDSDAWGRTSLSWLRIAGDAGGIAGARAAALAGEIVALGAARDLGAIDAGTCERLARPLRTALGRDMAVRPFLETLYRPAQRFRAPPQDGVTVCRCEEVCRGEIAAAVVEGCAGPNQLKSFTRCGMGPCQGRMCGHTVSELFAALTGRSVSDVGYFRIRMPIKPVTVGDIAGEAAAFELRDARHPDPE